MTALTFPAFTTPFIFLLCILNCLATPDVHIKQDYLHEQGLISYSNVLLFNADANNNNPVDALTDQQLMGLVKKAWEEMSEQYQALPDSEKVRGVSGPSPNVMVLMATGNKLFFASSIKGDTATWLNVQERAQGLTKPQALEAAAGGARLGGRHHAVNKGCCGEVNLMDTIWGATNALDFQGSGSRMTVWSRDSRRHINPCGDDGARYGCDTFIRAIANPNDPQSHLNPADIRYIDRTLNPDENWSAWPQGVNPVNKSPRAIHGDICAIARDPFDPNGDASKLRRRRYLRTKSFSRSRRARTVGP